MSIRTKSYQTEWHAAKFNGSKGKAATTYVRKFRRGSHGEGSYEIDAGSSWEGQAEVDNAHDYFNANEVIFEGLLNIEGTEKRVRGKVIFTRLRNNRYAYFEGAGGFREITGPKEDE